MVTRPCAVISLLAVWIALCGHVCNGGTELQMRQLLDSLLNSTEYSSRVRPILDTGSVLTVTVDMHLVAINDIDEVEQKLTTTAYLKLQWSDSFMQWDPSVHGNIVKITIPQDRIWKPDLALANAYDTVNGLGDDFIYITITDAGEIDWYPYQVFDSTCSLDMTYFPFDKQECDIELVTWSSTRDMISIVAGSDGFNTANYEANANWELLATSTADASTSTTAGISFKLVLKRKPTYFLLNFILPIVLLSILNVFVFLLPCESGEKTSYATIMFLSFAIFLLIVTEIMPDGMTNVPVMSTYLLFECVLSTIIVLLTICQLRLHYRGDKTPVPKFMKTFTYAVFAMKRKTCAIFKRKKKPEKPEAEKEGTVINDAGDEVPAPVVKKRRRRRTWKMKPPRKIRRRLAVINEDEKAPPRIIRNMQVFQPVLMRRRRKLKKKKIAEANGPTSTIDITEYKSHHQGIEMQDDEKSAPTHVMATLKGRKRSDKIDDLTIDVDPYQQPPHATNKRQPSRIMDFFTRRKKIGPKTTKGPTTIDEDEDAIAHVAHINLQNQASSGLANAYGAQPTIAPTQRRYQLVGRTSFTGSKSSRIVSATRKPLSDDVSGNMSFAGPRTARIVSATAANKDAAPSPPRHTSETVTPTGIRVSPVGSTTALSARGSLNDSQSSLEIRPSLAGSTTLSLYSRATSGRSTNAWSTPTTSINNRTPRSNGGRSSKGEQGVRRRLDTGRGTQSRITERDGETEIEEVVEMSGSSIAGSVVDIRQAGRQAKQAQFFIEQIEEEEEELEVEYREGEVTWYDVTTASDIVFFVIFFTLSILAIVIVFTVTAVGGSK